MEALKEKLLSSDIGRVQQHPKYKSADVKTKNESIFTWTLSVPGGKGTSWEGLVYDVEINFSRRHPFEPPRVEFPRTHRNMSNPGHPLVDGSGRLRMKRLSFDKWLPTIEASTVIGWLFHLFETEPPSVTSGNRCPFSHLSSEAVLQVISFLDAGDIGRLSQTGKHLLSLCFDEATWAKLYYRSSTSLDGLLGEKEGGACPVRVMGVSGKWYWEGAREAYIRSWEMRKACKGYAFAMARTQMMHAEWELGGLMTVSAGLLADIAQNRRLAVPAPANAGLAEHMEYLLDSQTMKIASLQRLLAWSRACRSLLSEKDEDRSTPRSMWDQSVGTFGSFGTSARARGRFTSSAGGGGSDCTAPGKGPDVLAGREPRLTANQRTALRLLCGNLAAFPAKTKASTAPGNGTRAAAGVSDNAASGTRASPGVERCPHHHCNTPSLLIPQSMGRVELQPRPEWRDVAPVPDAAGADQAGGTGGASPALINHAQSTASRGAGGHEGAGAGSAPDSDTAEDVIDVGSWSFSAFADGGAGGGSVVGPTDGPVRHSGATLLNPQPACGMGGMYWPTLYDLTRAKKLQKERLRDSFRRFTRGQRVDVRDPSGVWMGAVVLYAPRSCRGGAWDEASEAGGFHHGGHGGHGGGHGGGGGGGGGVGAAHAQVGVDAPGAQLPFHHPHSDVSMPEWRRLLQLAVLADDGHMRLTLPATTAHGAAAGGAPATGPAQDQAASLLMSADWVTTAPVDAAQAFLASAVSAAAPLTGLSWPFVPSQGPPGAIAAAETAAGAGAGPNPIPVAPGTPADVNDPIQYMIAALHMATGAGAGVDGAAQAGAMAVGALGAGNGGPTHEDAGGGVPAAASVGGGDDGGAAAGLLQQSWLNAGGGVAIAGAGPGGGKSVLIHYEGHKSRYDEWIQAQSPRLAPFRSRTTRPLSVTMQSVEKVLNGASVRAEEGVPAPDCVEVSLSCPWISHCAGGGVVTYRLPSTTILGAVLADFCHLGGISLRRAMIFRARLRLDSDMRRGSCDVEELDDRRTLKYFGVISGAVLHVAIAPATSDLTPSCIPHPRSRRPPGCYDEEFDSRVNGSGQNKAYPFFSEADEDSTDGHRAVGSDGNEGMSTDSIDAANVNHTD